MVHGHSFNSVEMHLSGDPDLVRKFGKKIKAAGGTYSYCRGNSYDRYITLPATETTLIDELVVKYKNGKTVMIARGSTARNAPAWVDVHYFTLADRKAERSPSAVLAAGYDKMIGQAIERGILKAREEEHA